MSRRLGCSSRLEEQISVKDFSNKHDTLLVKYVWMGMLKYVLYCVYIVANEDVYGFLNTAVVAFFRS